MPHYLRSLLFILAASFMTCQVQAGLYKWVDEHGRIHYSDRKPLDTQVESEAVAGSISTYGSPGYSKDVLATPNEKKPARQQRVTLYGTQWCGVCKEAKAYFRKNRIPFTEYDVETTEKGRQDYAKMNGRGVPIILVGDQRMNGFSQRNFEALYRGN